MATIKSFTDISQSKKLAEILPLESADKHWIILDGAISRATTYDYFDLQEYNQDKGTFREYIPCWSLAALISILPHIQEFHSIIGKINDKYVCRYASSGIWTNGANPVDACVAMIERLHELNLL